MSQLHNTTVIVTGAAAGIGRGIAEVLAERGAAVGVVDLNGTAAQEAADQLCAKGGKAEGFPCDVSDPDAVQTMIESITDRLGPIDGLVNNAGVNFVKPFEQMTLQDWDHVIGVDLRGTFLCIHGCIAQMLERRAGSIVNIASVHSSATLAGAAPYAAAKWAVTGMTKSLAIEYADRGIRFNCVSPGLIDTQIWRDIQDAAGDHDACMAHWRANIPIGRVGTPQEIGRTVAFLLSDDASYITGANLLADGGMTSQLISRAPYDG